MHEHEYRYLQLLLPSCFSSEFNFYLFYIDVFLVAIKILWLLLLLQYYLTVAVVIVDLHCEFKRKV